MNLFANAALKALMIFALILLFVWPAHSYETSYPANASWMYPVVVGSAADGNHTIPKLGLSLGEESTKGSPNLSRIFADGFEPDEPGGPVPFSCTHPDVAPAWMVGKQMLWSKMFSPRDGAPVPTYPNSNGFPVPIGADKGGWEAAKFVAKENQTVNMVWDRAQAKPNEGYGTARPAQGMFISISPCPGDLRPGNQFATDFLAVGCRKFQNEGTIIFSTMPTLPVSTSAACKLEAEKTYYITVSPVNPNDGLTPGEHTCDDVPSSANGCDVQSRSTAQ